MISIKAIKVSVLKIILFSAVTKTIQTELIFLALISNSLIILNFRVEIFKLYRKEEIQKNNKQTHEKTKQKQMKSSLAPPLTNYS